MTQASILPKLAPIAQKVRGCPTPVLIEAYISSVREFCRKSRWLEVAIPGSTTAPMVSSYITGTVTVTNGSPNVTGVGAAWLANAQAGDTFAGPNGITYAILAVSNDNLLVLTAPYGGATLAGQAYSIGRQRFYSVYALGDDPYTEIIGVRAVQVSKTLQQAYGLDDRTGSATWDPNETAAVPEEFSYVSEGQIAVWPKPDAAYPLLVAAILQPKEGAVTVELSLLTQWEQAFQAGSLARLQDIPGMAWSNPQQAAKNAAIFSDWMNRGTSAAERRNSTRSQPW